MKWQWKKQDARYTRVQPVIEKMLSGATEIATALYEQTPEYLPFHDNEAAGVSLLCGGAAKKGCFPVAEYPVTKKTWDAVQNKFGQKPSALKSKNLMQGRADLSILHDGRYFSFEFKKTSERHNRVLGEKGLRSNLEYFHDYCGEEIDRVHDDEYHHIMAGIIAPVFKDTKVKVLEQFSDEVSMSALLGSKRSYQVYFFFSSLSMFG